MAGFLKKQNEVIRREFRELWATSTTLDNTDANYQLVTRLVRIPKKQQGRMRVKGGQLWFGVTDDPADESVHIVLARHNWLATAKSSFPQVDIFFLTSLYFRTIGAGTTTLITSREYEIMPSKEWLWDDHVEADVGGTDQTLLAIWCDSGTVQSQIRTGGILLMEEEIFQRKNSRQDHEGYEDNDAWMQAQEEGEEYGY